MKILPPLQQPNNSRARLFAPLLLAGLLAGCSAVPNTSISGSAPAAPQSQEAAAPAAQNLSNDSGDLTQSKAVAATPQLVKTAQLTVEVKAVNESVKAVAAVLKERQGDLLSLQDNRPIDVDAPYSVQMQLRVPQAQLDTVLAVLGKLGSIQSQALRAEDVSTQLVDTSARLRNLRRTESSLLDIMGRSGSVGDVLKVSQELSRVREQIEQIDAQLANLKNRVAYSTIDLTLQSALGNRAAAPTWSTQLQNAWEASTRSLSDFSLTMLKFLIWLMVYSPYWGSIVALIILWRRHRRSRRLRPPVPVPPQSEPL